jgi:chorismate synthase
MTSNGFGKIFRFTTWGESHGPAIGCVVDGVPPLIPLTEEDIQFYLDKRKPGQSRFTTQRQESDTVKILSGVFEGKTTGTSIGLMIQNEDQRSKDYGEIKDKFRPGHADYTYEKKYGIRDYRGGGRSSARETAMRVAAGAIARKIITFRSNKKLSINGALIQIGPHKIDRAHWDWNEVERNSFWSPDVSIVSQWSEFLDGVRKSGSSAGAIIEIVATDVPVGLGEPIYGKLDSDLACAMMSINAVKAVEIGDGFDLVSRPGKEASDEMCMVNDAPAFLSNTAGGILGGITTGQPVVVRFAVKPTSSILSPRRSIDKFGSEVEVITKGRHDPCVGIRAVPVGEAMMACVLADHILRFDAQCNPYQKM